MTGEGNNPSDPLGRVSAAIEKEHNYNSTGKYSWARSIKLNTPAYGS
jgi:hypothetical protein